MLRLLALIPEPWGTIGLALAFVAAWAYGDVTGKGSERQRNAVASLTQTVNELERQRETSLSIQTRMALTMSELRQAREVQKGEVSSLVDELRKKPPARACLLDSAMRMRLRSIRIGEPTPAPKTR